MTPKRHTIHALVTALVGGTLLLLAGLPPPRADDRLGIVPALPSRVGAREAVELLYCHSEDCSLMPCTGPAGSLPDRCPRCGGSLHAMALAEKALLPADTEILRKLYVLPNQPSFQVAVVISGRERQSIHRPQACLVGQGNTIVRERNLLVPAGGAAGLTVRLLELTRSGEGGDAAGASWYAYWFTAQGHETPSHIERLFWTAWDSLVHNTRHRWAYVSVAGQSTGNRERDDALASEFISGLYPLLSTKVAEAR